MKKLIITANPSKEGFTHKITQKLSELSVEKNDELKIINLYNSDLKQDFLTYEDKREMGQDSLTKANQELILWAEEIVFISPIWWGGMPAIMKNYWDSNFMARFAYRYKKGGKHEGLLGGRQVRFIFTSGGPSWFYYTVIPLYFIYKYALVQYCGMKLKSFTVFGNMDRSSTNRDNYLLKIDKLV